MLRRLALLILLAATAATGCGDDAEPGASSEAPAEDESILVAALGDSITAGSPLWDPDPQVREAIGSALDERSQFEYWTSEADPSITFRNCGVFGERTDEIALRLGECADGADALIVQGGINDIAQGRPVAEAAADLRAMVESGRSMGLPVAIADVLPWNNGHPAADAPIEKLNRAIAGIAEDEEIPMLPFHDTLEDPDEPGTMKAGWTNDDDHPSIEGYRRLAERAVPSFEAIGE